MPIIIDNFHVNTDLPIDNRFVVGGTDSFYSSKELIQYKYQGLRIWDLTDNIPYYWTGVTWSSENSVGVSSVSGESNYLTKFTGPTVISKSLLYENQGTKQIGLGIYGGFISANTTSGGVIINSATSSLHVLGNIKTNNNFIGNGLYVTNINATNINSGLLDIRYISHLQGSNNPLMTITPGNTYVLLNNAQTNGVSWANSNTISVANSTNSSNVGVVSDTSSTTNNYLTFVQSTGNVPIKINTSKIQFKPSNGQLFLIDGSNVEPTYSFLNSPNTGMYYNNSGSIDFTIGGVKRLGIEQGSVTIYDTLYPQVTFYKSPSDVQKLFVGIGNVLKYRLNAWDPLDAVQIASDAVVWHSSNLNVLKSIGNATPETNRNFSNLVSTDGVGNRIKGLYTYNAYNTILTPLSSQVHWSIVSFGKADEGSVQLASNWYGNISQNGTVVADRDILFRSLRDTIDDWSPWVKVWNSGNSGYIPFGGIMMWSGLTTQIPTGWRLCDGNGGNNITIAAGSIPGQPNITSITIPDLRERFIVGAGDNSQIDVRSTYDSFYYYHWTANATLTGSFPIDTGGSNANLFTIDTTKLFYITTTGLGVTLTSSSFLTIGVLTIRPMIYICSSLNAFFAFDMRVNQYRLFKGTAFFGGNYATNYFTFDTPLTEGLGTYAEYNKYFSAGIRFNLPIRTGAETTNLLTISWDTEYGYAVGATGGSDNVRISESQLGPHRHKFGPLFRDSNYGDNNMPPRGSNNSIYGFTTTTLSGGFQPIENRPPYYALAFIIYVGI